MLQKLNVIFDGEHYLTFINKTSWQNHSQQINSLALTELKNVMAANSTLRIAYRFISNL